MKNAFFYPLALLATFFSYPLLTAYDPHYVVAATESDPATLIHNSVNVITGDYLASGQEIVVSGAEPLHLNFVYISSKAEDKRGGWAFIPHLYIHLNVYTCLLEVTQPSGTVLNYKLPYDPNYKPGKKYKFPGTVSLTLVAQTELEGLSNTAHHEVSARTNLKNQRIEMDDDEAITVRTSEGGVRYYKKIFYTKRNTTLDYALDWEKLPSGNRIMYTYNSEGRIERITTVNPNGSKVYAEARIKYLGNSQDNRDFDVETSDHQLFHYRFKAKKTDQDSVFVPEEITSREGSKKVFIHVDSHDKKRQLFSHAFVSGGEVRQVEYYEPQENKTGKETVTLSSDGDPRCYRVRALYALSDEEMKLTHRFIYVPGEQGNQGGHTEVYDAEGNRTVYYYTSSLHLERIERFYRKEGREGLYNRERFVFGKSHTPESGLLLCKTLMDHESNPIASKTFTYDAKGNVIEETLHGDLSGQGSELKIDGSGFPIKNRAEQYSKRFSYNERNLKIREEEDNGRVTLFSYHQDTDRLASRLFLERGQVKIRHFFEYNSNLVLVREMVDDGTTHDRNDLTGVSERRIKQIVPHSGTSFFGMPEMVEQKFLDLASKQEKLLKKITFIPSQDGKITQHQVFDANDVAVYTVPGGYESAADVTEVDAWLHAAFPKVREDRVAVQMVKQRAFEVQLPAMSGRDGNVIYPQNRRFCDIFGNEVSVTNALGETTLFFYNARGQLTKTVYPDGACTRIFYHLDGTPKQSVDQVGTVTTFYTDSFGREIRRRVTSREGEKLSVEQWAYNAFHLTRYSDTAGVTVLYTYDGAGRKRKEEIPTFSCTEYTYDSLGHLHTVQEGLGKDIKRVVTERDVHGTLLEEWVEGSEAGVVYSHVRYHSAIPQAHGKIARQKWVTRFVEGKESKEEFDYDAGGRLIQHINGLGDVILYREYDDHFVNHLGQQVVKKTETDALGIVTVEIYDAFNRVVSVEKKNRQGQLLINTLFSYDAVGNLVAERKQIFSNGQLARELENQRSYGLMGRLQVLVEAVGTDVERVTSYAYDPAGRCIEITKPNGVVVKNLYDGLGRIVRLATSDESVTGSVAGSVDYAYRYKNSKYPVQIENLQTNEVIARTYDPAGRVLSETSSRGVQVEHEWDSLGRQRTTILPDHSKIEYVYKGLLPQEVIRKSPSGSSTYTHQYTAFDSSFRLTGEQLIGNLGQCHHSFDLLGRQIALESTHGKEEIEGFRVDGKIQTYSSHLGFGDARVFYTYDELGQLTEESGLFAHTLTWDAGGGLLHRDGKTAHHNILGQLFSTDASEFTFDSKGNPLSKKMSYGEIRYFYDSSGHLVEIVNPDGKHISFQGNNLYQLHTLNPLLSSECVLYSYDTNGNVLSKRSREGDFYFFYDGLDRVVEVIKPQEIRLCFTYDGFNRRQTKTRYNWKHGKWDMVKHIDFFWSGNQEMGAMSKGSLALLRVLGAHLEHQGDKAIAIEVNGVAYAPQYDIRGNIGLMVSLETGKLAESYKYSAFGMCRIFNPQQEQREMSVIGNPWRSSGESIDEETGLVFQGKRLFDPEISLWMNH